jgi:HlyD family secretion protein
VTRARQLRDSGFISAQEMERTENQEKTARARIDSLSAQLAVSRLRLSQARVLAPADGVISARKAVAGMSPQSGAELFRLIVQSRLEWQAEVAAADMATLKPGLRVDVSAPGTQAVTGVVRAVSPSVDPRTRQGMVYVDLPVTEAQKAGLRAGMFASGQFNLASTPAMTLPVTAVQLRDGFNVVFEIKQNKAVLHQVAVGRRLADRLEIVSGLGPDAQIVSSGVGFLNDGDTVRVLASSAASE